MVNNRYSVRATRSYATVPNNTANVPPEGNTTSPSASGFWQSRVHGYVLLGGLLSCAAFAVLQRKNHVAQANEPDAEVQAWGTPGERIVQYYKAYDSNAEGCLGMPSRSDQYDGIEDKRHIDVYDDEHGTANIFAVGDWGATLPYHDTFAGFGSDQHAQLGVADAMKRRAAWADPQYVLNVGDNFYVGGMEGHTCQDPPDHDRPDILAKFDSIWVKMYAPLSSKPWLSVLGNHDYGGYRFDGGWPQQIGYSFINHNWIMPARYYTKRVHHSNFVVDYIMFDSNVYDAKPPGENEDHNICGMHNYGGMGRCDNNGGMRDVGSCRAWFQESWRIQKEWAEKKLWESDADWKIIVTHFPCGYETEWYKIMKAKHGLDLVVTGHRHQQELWWPGSSSKYLSSFFQQLGWDHNAPVCFVTGGGGGIVSQKFSYADYGRDLTWYGFFHLTINKYWMKIELVNTNDQVAGNVTIHPHGSAENQKQMEEWSKLKPSDGLCDFFCGDTNNPWSKVCYSVASCAGCSTCKNLKAGKVCDDYCGVGWGHTWDKVCAWLTCKGCPECKPPDTTTYTTTTKTTTNHNTSTTIDVVPRSTRSTTTTIDSVPRPDRSAKEEAEQRAKLAAEQKAKEAAELKAKEEAEQKAKAAAEQKAKEAAEQKVKEAAEQKAKEEAEQKAKELAEKKAKQEAELKAKEAAEQQAKQEAEQKAREEAKQKAQLAAEQKAKEAAEQEAKEEAETKAKEEAELTTRSTTTTIDAVPRPDRSATTTSDSVPRPDRSTTTKIDSVPGPDRNIITTTMEAPERIRQWVPVVGASGDGSSKDVLKVIVVGASGLWNESVADPNDTAMRKPKPDPYVIVEVQGKEKSVHSTFHTPVVKNSYGEPQWNYRGELSDFDQSDLLHFTVLDKDWFPAGKADDLLGEATLSIGKIPKDETGFDGELKLASQGKRPTASLHIKVQKAQAPPYRFLLPQL